MIRILILFLILLLITTLFTGQVFLSVLVTGMDFTDGTDTVIGDLITDTDQVISIVPIIALQADITMVAVM